ncbi:hypothetical protein [Streptomyces sp. NPDC020607]|uniref:hypothetical protein n=1 Tax=Streptomyces sp. NPDC020607 TaxID=3365082 RepID=UPI0037A4D58F
MRLRHTIGAALGALVLTTALPTSAEATMGYVTYKIGAPGPAGSVKLDYPKSTECIEIPEVEAGKSEHAWGLDNNTYSQAWLFPEDECGGDRLVVKAGAKDTTDFKFKSIYFHDPA